MFPERRSHNFILSNFTACICMCVPFARKQNQGTYGDNAKLKELPF